jgi:hypothetical protein
VGVSGSGVIVRARSLTLILAVTMLIAVASSARASGYRTTRFDANDQGKEVPDIRSTTRKVWLASNGHRYLTVTIRTSVRMPPWFDGLVALDSRGGSLRDHRMHIWHYGADGHGCDVNRIEGSFKQHGHWVRCRVPLRFVHANKRIRWRMSLAGFDVGADYAPDRGWYV